MSDSQRKIVLVDMDGTLSDVSHRIHHIRGKKNWKQFFRLMDQDPPVAAVVDWVRNLAEDHEIVIVTGRPDDFRRNTEDWLKRYAVPYSRLLMRRSGDHRPDHVVKKELLERVDKHNVAFVIDDRPTVCDMWRGCGLKVYQVRVGEEY